MLSVSLGFLQTPARLAPPPEAGHGRSDGEAPVLSLPSHGEAPSKPTVKQWAPTSPPRRTHRPRLTRRASPGDARLPAACLAAQSRTPQIACARPLFTTAQNLPKRSSQQPETKLPSPSAKLPTPRRPRFPRVSGAARPSVQKAGRESLPPRTLSLPTRLWLRGSSAATRCAACTEPSCIAPPHALRAGQRRLRCGASAPAAPGAQSAPLPRPPRFRPGKYRARVRPQRAMAVRHAPTTQAGADQRASRPWDRPRAPGTPPLRCGPRRRNRPRAVLSAQRRCRPPPAPSSARV